MNDAVFKPHVLPRDARDALFTIAIGVFQTTVLFVLPGAVAYWLSGSLVLAIGVLTLAFVIYAFFSVSQLTLSPSGIHFERLLGTPKFVPWSSVTAVEEASREELIRRGWLWPPFPAREMSASLSSLGHYAIRFGNDAAYFPPRDPVAFMDAVRSYGGDRA